MKALGKVILGAVLVAVAGGGTAALSKPSTDASRVITIGRTPLALGVDAHAGHVFVVNMDGGGGARGTVSMLDARDGTVRRTVPVGYFPRDIVVDERRGRAFVITTDVAGLPMKASVSVLDTRDGHVRRAVALGASPSFVGIDRTAGHVFVGLSYGHMNGRLRLLDEATERLGGTITLGFYPEAMAVDERRGRAIVVGPDRAYADRLAVLDTRDGRVLRTSAAGGFVSTGVAVDTRQGHAFVATVAGSAAACVTPGGVCHTPGTVHMLDIRDGRALQAAPVGDNPSSIVVDERTRRVFVVNSGTNQGDIGTVSVLDANAGRLVRTTVVGYGPASAAVDTRRGHVYVTNVASAMVSVLDARDGRLLGARRVVAGPGAVAVDERTGRVYVASADVSDGIIPIDPHATRTILDQASVWGRELTNEWRVLHKGRTGTISVFDTDGTT